MKINKYKIAKELGVSFQVVYKWFDGKCMPRADRLVKLADILGVTPSELLIIMKKANN